MKGRQPYTECKLYVDGIPQLQPGHYLRTRGGSGYYVAEMRQSPTRPRRRNLRCIRTPVADIPTGAIVHELVWYPRAKKRGRRLA